MKSNKFMSWVLSLAVAAACNTGCTTNNEPTNNTPTPEPAPEYVRLNLLSGCGYSAATENAEVTRAIWVDANGEGNLTLKWEKVDINSDKTNGLSLILSNGENPIYGKTQSDATISDEEATYSGMAVTPHTRDAHHADFRTVLYYDANELDNASYCYAVSGEAQITVDEENEQHLCHMEMPATFTQTTSQDPRFLRDNMYMYAAAIYDGERTILDFDHIPATFRFIITNTTAEAISLQEASISLSEEGAAVASQSTDLTFDWDNLNTTVAFGQSGHSKVTVNTKGISVEKDNAYTAYAMALPLADNNAFNGKTLNFSVKSNDQEQVAFQLSGTELAELNGSDIYNWVSGKSYTIRINIREDGKASGEIIDGNRIAVTPSASGRYSLMYEGADGQPLAAYAAICTLPIKEMAYYEDFIDVNIAPREANAIGIYDADGNRQGTIQLASFKPDYTEAPQYSFGLLSDVHIGRDGINAESDFEKALAFFNANGVIHTCICGDISQNGTEAEFKSYSEIASLSETPVYTTTGNHDCTTSGINLTLWNKYINLPLVFEQEVENNGKVDHFLFFGMSVWNFSSAYLEKNILWLQEKLEEYKNDRCIIITHLFFPDRAGNLNNIYPSGNWLTGSQLARLQKMCDRYVNAIWFSGHSHWEWQLQKYQDRANIYRTYEGTQPTSGWCVHVPSCGTPITSNGTSREDNTAGSEGAILHVYENHVDILGIDFKTGKYLPIATYRLDTTPYEVIEEEEDEEDDTPQEAHYITASDFVVNETKVAGATVKDVEGMPNYVEVTFTKKGQGFYICNSTYSTSATWVSITVEDAQATSDGEEIDMPPYVGFYSGDYHMTSTDAAQVFHKENGKYDGVQFQTSNSKYGSGPLPLTIRMKVQMKFQ